MSTGFAASSIPPSPGSSTSWEGGREGGRRDGGREGGGTEGGKEEGRREACN